jgi:hypothetical protein
LPSNPADGERGLAAHLGIAVGKEVEGLGFGQLLAADREAEIGNGLVEEPRPGGPPGDVLLVKQLLDFVRELVRAKGAGITQPRAIARECRIGLLRREIGVIEPIELEREEQQCRRDRVDLLLHRLEEPADLRVGEIAGMDQRGVADDAPACFLQPLVGCHGGRECGTGEIGEPPLIARAEGVGIGSEGRKVARQRRAVAAGIEV